MCVHHVYESCCRRVGGEDVSTSASCKERHIFRSSVFVVRISPTQERSLMLTSSSEAGLAVANPPLDRDKRILSPKPTRQREEKTQTNAPPSNLPPVLLNPLHFAYTAKRRTLLLFTALLLFFPFVADLHLLVHVILFPAVLLLGQDHRRLLPLCEEDAGGPVIVIFYCVLVVWTFSKSQQITLAFRRFRGVKNLHLGTINIPPLPMRKLVS